jgi:hypothetical protein
MNGTEFIGCNQIIDEIKEMLIGKMVPEKVKIITIYSTDLPFNKVVIDYNGDRDSRK